MKKKLWRYAKCYFKKTVRYLSNEGSTRCPTYQLTTIFFNLFGLNPEFKFDTFSADVFVVNGAFFTFFG